MIFCSKFINFAAIDIKNLLVQIPIMKKTIYAIAILATMMLTACGSGPDLDDPKSIAKWNCDKMGEMMSLITDPVANASKIEALGKEVEELEKKFEAHHGEKSEEMNKKVEEALKDVCPEYAKSF